MSAIEAAPQRGWLDVAERGSVFGIEVLVWLCTVWGRAPARLLLRVVAFYYVALSRGVRRSSRDYLRRLGEPASFGQSYQHVLRFAQVALDRFFILTKRYDAFEVSYHGHEHIEGLLAAGQGGILLGAHLGSFEAMRMHSDMKGVVVNAIGRFTNARMVNSALAKVSPGVNTRVIHLDETSAGAVLEVRERLRRGELVAVLGDRLAPGGKFAEVDFLGGKARFPTGPFLLASILKCPVFLTFGLHHVPNRYDIYCEPFADAIDLPRKARDAALQEHVQRFATRLEHFVRLAPDNWFNFYDFWSP